MSRDAAAMSGGWSVLRSIVPFPMIRSAFASFAAHLYKRGLKPRDYILDSEIRADTREEKTLRSLRLCGEFFSVAASPRCVLSCASCAPFLVASHIKALTC